MNTHLKWQVKRTREEKNGIQAHFQRDEAPQQWFDIAKSTHTYTYIEKSERENKKE